MNSPCTRLRIGPPDQIIHLINRLGPVNLGMLMLAPRFVSCLRFVLPDAWRVSGAHKVNRLQSGLDSQRKDFLEIDGAERVVRTNYNLLLQEYFAFVKAVVRPKECQPRPGCASDERPIDGAWAAVPG